MTAPEQGADILLDISRLIARSGQEVPTGVDRVELAWARHLIAHHADRLHFSALHPAGRYNVLPFALAVRFCEALSRQWEGGAVDEISADAPKALGRRLRRSLWLPARRRPKAGCFHLIVSHHHLTRSRLVGRVLARFEARLAVMIHDLIPIEFPEYGREGEDRRHLARMKTVLRHAEAVVTPTVCVRESVLRLAAQFGRPSLPVHAVALGTDSVTTKRALLPVSIRHRGPYFLFISTIEPRKNHWMILKIWRRLVERLGRDAPDLVLIGKRGWENENVVDMLERCPGLAEHVHEFNSLPDAEVHGLIRGCRALLFPSFSEGYGLPLAEALNSGAPVLCSDIPVFREIGGSIPDYVDPLDGPGWERLIMSYVEDDGPREAQMVRLGDWKGRDWDTSVAEGLARLGIRE